MNEKKNLSVKELIVLGGALFSMHFGASCMLYPVTWGKEAGTSVFLVYIAIVCSALLLPFLAYVALARGEGTFSELTKRIIPRFGRFFVCLTGVLLGPLYIVPRMSAASWDALTQVFNIQTESIIPIFLFNLVYYLITYWFIANPGETMDKIGKILFPILIVIVVGVIGKGLITPISTEWQPKSFEEPALVYGFLQGYQTGDLPAALLFGLVIISGVRNAGIAENRINANLVKLGIVGLGMLAVTHLGHMIIGASTANTIDLSLSKLYAEVVLQLWGMVGAIVFNIALMFAALTTAVGCCGAFCELVSSEFPSFSYKKAALVSCGVSTVIATIGLDNVVAFFGPLLNACYPAAIILVLYYCIAPKAGPKWVNACRWATMGAFICGCIDVLSSYDALFGINSPAFAKFYGMLPLSGYMLTWVIVAAVCFAIGALTYKEPKAA